MSSSGSQGPWGSPHWPKEKEKKEGKRLGKLHLHKKCSKICWSPNLESYLHMRMESNIGGGELFSYL